MKPKWKDAPEWAQWLAQDKNGGWCWYESKPVCEENVWTGFGGQMGDAYPESDWKDSMESRPCRHTAELPLRQD